MPQGGTAQHRVSHTAWKPMKTPVTVFLLLLLFGAAASAHAQGIKWKALNKEVMTLYQKGQYDRAVVVAKKALDMAEKAVGPNHPSVATSLNNLAGLYGTQGRYAEAEPLYRRSLAIREKALGPDYPDVAATLENIAKLHRTIGRAKEAESLEARAARIRAITR